MFLSDPQPNEAVESNVSERSLSIDDPLPFEPARKSAPPRDPGQASSLPAPITAGPAGETAAVAPEAPKPSAATDPKRRTDARWWVLAAGSALLLALLTAGGIWLITKKPSTVD